MVNGVNRSYSVHSDLGGWSIPYEKPGTRAPLVLPDNARVAVWVVPNVEFYEFMPDRNENLTAWPRTPAPDVMSYSYRQFGNTVGFWRMLDVLDQFDVRASTSINLGVLDAFPEICRAMVDRNWEFMTHGLANTKYLYGMSEADEAAFYQQNIAEVKRLTGKRLKGMLGPAYTSTIATPRLMADAGLYYTADFFIDDEPFDINVASGARLVGVPYTRQLNVAIVFKYTSMEGDDFEQICRDQFDVLYAEGADRPKVMCIALHPYIIGQAHRVDSLANILSYIKGHDDVWWATADEIADVHISQVDSSPSAAIAGGLS